MSLGTNQTLKRINCNTKKWGKPFSGCLNNRKYRMNKGKKGFKLDYGYVNTYETRIHKVLFVFKCMIIIPTKERDSYIPIHFGSFHQPSNMCCI